MAAVHGKPYPGICTVNLIASHYPLRLWLCVKRAAGKAAWAESLRLLAQLVRRSGLATVATAIPASDSIEATRGR